MDTEWTAADGWPCTDCGTVVPVVSEDGVCPLCWAERTGDDADHVLGQAIAVEGLLMVDTAPELVADCVLRLRHLSEHTARPALLAVLSEAARDLEALAAQAGSEG
jgi:hypothetical protein